MGLFSSTPKNYASIVAPLKQIESELSTYIGDQENNISDLEAQKAEIEAKIGDSQMEIRKSQGTVVKISELLSFDLDEYVTNGALNGLFSMLAEEERKIRQNPAARVTDLLKEVFSK